MKPWARRMLEAAAGATLLGAALVWLSGGCGERIEPGEVQRAEERLPEGAATARVEERVGPLVERASGAVASARHTTVSSEILARIAEVRVGAGSLVSRDDVLVVLDSRDLQARAREAGEALRAARARLDLARSEAARLERLFQAEVASQQELDRARSALRVASAEVQAAEQRVADAEVALSYGEIRAPVAGRVIDRMAEPGDTAAPGAPLLRIYDPSALRLEAPVRESLAVTLAPGQPLDVEIEALGARLQGTIDEIVPFAEPGARTLLVKVRLPQGPRLYAGMFGRLEIPAGEGRRLLVPQEAIARVGQLEFATVVGGDRRLERRLVTTGAAAPGGRIEVLSGLSPDERVLLPSPPG